MAVRLNILAIGAELVDERRTADTAIDTLQQKLDELMNDEVWFIVDEKDEIRALCTELGHLRTFLEDSVKKLSEYEKLRNLRNQIRDWACEAAVTIDVLVIRTGVLKTKSKNGDIEVLLGNLSTDEIIEHAYLYTRHRFLDIIREKGPISEETRKIDAKELYATNGDYFRYCRMLLNAFSDIAVFLGNLIRDEIIEHVCHSTCRRLPDITSEMESISEEIRGIYHNQLYGIGDRYLLSRFTPMRSYSINPGQRSSKMAVRLNVLAILDELIDERLTANSAVDSLLQKLMQLMDDEVWFILDEKDEIGALYMALGLLRTFLKDSVKKLSEYEELRNLTNQIRDWACKAGVIIDVLVIRTITLKKKSVTKNFLSVSTPYCSRLTNALSAIAVLLGNISKYEIIHHVCRSTCHRLPDFIREMESISEEIRKIYDKKLYGIGVPQVVKYFRGSSSKSSAPNVEEDNVIGFEQEVETIKEGLIARQKKQLHLQVISIVGMAGLGKTTLARKLYNDSLIVYYFDIRGWTYVSQVYRKEDLLLEILSTVVQHKSEIQKIKKEKFGEELYRRLKGRRYLIVIDDIWDIEAWYDLKKSFPDDNNGSRILLTSRLKDVAFCAQLPHFLRGLSHDESWLLLQRKVFWNETCPPELVDSGKQIAKKCQGLPLAIVVVAGLLAKAAKTQDWWKQVAERMSSYIVSQPEQCLDILALSYNHLPYHLKPCFLYLGAFPEDYEIPVRKLIWLWIAEGFIQKSGQKSLEDVAEEYLLDLIDRSLVSVAQKKSTGEIRACRVHDLLRDLCLKKAEEENFLLCDLCMTKAAKNYFLQHIYGYEEVSSTRRPIEYEEVSSSPRHSCFFTRWHGLRLHFYKYGDVSAASGVSSSSIPIVNKQRRLCIHSRMFLYVSDVHSFLCFSSSLCPFSRENLSIIYQLFKLIRVLDLSAIGFLTFPSEVVQLVLLRYLALQGPFLTLPSSISKLCNLETLITSGSRGFSIPPKMWKMVNMRHLCLEGQNHVFGVPDDGSLCVLENLQTISQVCPSRACRAVLAKTPNLRQLRFCGSLTSNELYRFLDIDFLNKLESLKFLNDTSPSGDPQYRLEGIKFPPSLKRLTLSRTYLDWKEMSIIGMLPNLESLKLQFQACNGPLWETNDGGFPQLKYLRLNDMNIEQWNASRSHFPRLQHLVLHKCGKLEEIPSELGHIQTLQTIDVSWCSHATVSSARQIQEEQMDELQVFIYPPDQELTTYY